VFDYLYEIHGCIVKFKLKSYNNNNKRNENGSFINFLITKNVSLSDFSSSRALKAIWKPTLNITEEKLENMGYLNVKTFNSGSLKERKELIRKL